ncbi:hypothetical protein [Frondihabitans cladoniiphilus]
MNESPFRLPSPRSPLSSPIRSSRSRVVLAALLILGVLASLVPATPAAALRGAAHGVGYLHTDGVSWIGTYRLDDGGLAFCLEAGRASPIGSSYESQLTDAALGHSREETAQVAYILRKWVATPDPDAAAAAALAVWTIMGLNGHSQAWYASRAGDRARQVLTLTGEVLREAASNANVDQKVDVRFDIDADGRLGVTTDLVLTHIGGRTSTAPDSAAVGRITATGATIPDGSSSGLVVNGERRVLTPTGEGAVTAISVSADYADLPFGAAVAVGTSVGGAQALLLPVTTTGLARGASAYDLISPLPFQPRVLTKTSAATAESGTLLRDELSLDVEPGDGLLREWGVFRSGDGFAPIPVTIRSRLLGPFASAPTVEPDWPSDAPEVCTVETVMASGPGTTTTAGCTIPTAGYYVWVESIDPADTPVDQGRDRLRPWRSPFGVATEVTLTPALPSIVTRADASTAAPGSCVSDHLEATGIPSGVSLEVESLLVGPLAERIEDGHDFTDDLGPGLDGLPVAGRTTTTVVGGFGSDADAEAEAGAGAGADLVSATTDCVDVPAPGHYAFVLRSPGTEADADGRQLVPAFADLVAHRAEMIDVPEPEVPTVPPTPPAPPSPPAAPAKPAALAFTGDEVLPKLLAGAGALSVGVFAVLGTLVARRLRARSTVAASDAEA